MVQTSPIKADSIKGGKPKVIQRGNQVEGNAVYFSSIESSGVLIKRYCAPFCLIQVYWCAVEVKRPYFKRSEECGPIQG